jgi:translocation and assembly module TamB
MRKLISTLASLSGVLIVVILLVILVLATEAGSRWLIQYGASRVPNQLAIRHIQGSVLTGLSLYGIEHRIDQKYTRIEHVELSWQPMALLRGMVHLQSLYIEGITYTVPATKEISAKDTIRLPPDISFPFTLVIEDARLERLVFRRGDTQHALDYVHLAGRADRNGLRLKQFEAEEEDIHVNLQGHAKLSQPYKFQANLNWSARLPDGLKVRGKYDISGDIDTIKFTHKLSEPFSLNTQGEVNMSRILPKSNLKGNQQMVQRPLTGEAVYRRGKGQYHFQSKTDSYQLTFNGDFTGPNLPTTHIQAYGRGNQMSFQVEKLEAHTLGGMVKVNGHIIWQPEPRWEFKVTAINIDPSMHWPEWSGKLALNSELQGDIDAGIPTILLHKLRIVGHLLEQPFQVAGDLTFRDKQLAFDDISIRSGKNQLNVDGTVATYLDLTFNVDAPDPASLWPGFRGQLRGKVSIKGTRSNPTAKISLEGNNISYGHYTVKNLDAYFVVDSNTTRRSNARISLLNLLVGGEVFPSLSLNWVGDFKSHRVRAEFVSASASAEFEFIGSFRQDIWELKIDTASFMLKKYGMWRLINPVGLLVSHTEVKPFKACWVKEKSNVCVQAFWNDESGWRAEGDVSAPPLRSVIDLLKELLMKENLGWGKGA